MKLLAVLRLADGVRQDDHALVPIRPAAEAKRRLVRTAAHDDRVDGADEVVVAVRLLVERMYAQPVDGAVGPGDEPVEAGGNEDRKPGMHPVILPRRDAARCQRAPARTNATL